MLRNEINEKLLISLEIMNHRMTLISSFLMTNFHTKYPVYVIWLILLFFHKFNINHTNIHKITPMTSNKPVPIRDLIKISFLVKYGLTNTFAIMLLVCACYSCVVWLMDVAITYDPLGILPARWYSYTS